MSARLITEFGGKPNKTSARVWNLQVDNELQASVSPVITDISIPISVKYQDGSYVPYPGDPSKEINAKFVHMGKLCFVVFNDDVLQLVPPNFAQNFQLLLDFSEIPSEYQNTKNNVTMTVATHLNDASRYSGSMIIEYVSNNVPYPNTALICLLSAGSNWISNFSSGTAPYQNIALPTLTWLAN